jgi:hypothetical protein
MIPVIFEDVKLIKIFIVSVPRVTFAGLSEAVVKVSLTPKPPKGGFITNWISISPPWGI